MTGCPCSLCGETMSVMVYPVIVPGKAAIVHVTCFNLNCPVEGRTLSQDDHLQLVEQTRREIVLNYSFDRCLARPCSATLTAALVFLVEGTTVARFQELRAGYCRFVRVCWLPDLLAAAEALMQRCVPVNGAATVSSQAVRS